MSRWQRLKYLGLALGFLALAASFGGFVMEKWFHPDLPETHRMSDAVTSVTMAALGIMALASAVFYLWKATAGHTGKKP